MRRTGAVLVAVALALAGVVAPVVTLPVPAAHAVRPSVEEVVVRGVSSTALRDPSAVTDATVAADVDKAGAQPQGRHDLDAAGQRAAVRGMEGRLEDALDDGDKHAAGEASDGGPAHASADLAALSPLTDTRPFVVAGVTWDEPTEDVVEAAVRVREDGKWTAWSALEIVSTGVPGERGGTEPLVSPGADGVQLRVVTADGSVPAGLRAELVDPGASPADAAVGRTAAPAASASAATADVLRPAIVTRAQWGADESRTRPWRTVSSRLRALYVHHTAGSNSYSRSQSAAIVRGIFAYHTGSRDWPDIGYQFLVDKYGRIFQGRSHAVRDLPLGAHAGGFNIQTIGIAALGNYDTATPSAALRSALRRFLAWKAYEHNLDPGGTTTLVAGTSTGSGMRYRQGATVRVPVITSHRATNYTACPGARLQSRLGELRAGARSLVAATRERYGRPRSTTARPTGVAWSASQRPVHWGSSATFRWYAASGAARYQVQVRSASATSAMPDGRTWTRWGVVSQTRATLRLSAGSTTVVAVRPVDSSGRLGPLRVLGTTTRPVSDGFLERGDSWSLVRDPAYEGGRAWHAARAGATILARDLQDVRQVRIMAPVGPRYGQVRVLVNGRQRGVIDLSSPTSRPRAVRTLDLGARYDGTVRLSAVTSEPVRISAVAFPRSTR